MPQPEAELRNQWSAYVSTVLCFRSRDQHVGSAPNFAISAGTCGPSVSSESTMRAKAVRSEMAARKTAAAKVQAARRGQTARREVAEMRSAAVAPPAAPALLASLAALASPAPPALLASLALPAP